MKTSSGPQVSEVNKNMLKGVNYTVELDAHKQVVRVGRQWYVGGDRVALEERLAVAAAARALP